MRYFAIILIGLTLLCCGNSDRPEKPDNVIPEEKMSDIIYDVFLLNAAKGINKRVLEQNGINPQEYIFKKYNIDSLQFAISNDYYAYDTKTYEAIMQKVKQKIEIEKKKNDSLLLNEEKVKDSLREFKNRNPKSDSLKLNLKSKVLKTS
jgi:hypothetical protein